MDKSSSENTAKSFDVYQLDEDQQAELINLLTELYLGACENTLYDEDKQAYQRIYDFILQGANLEAELFESTDDFDSDEVGQGQVYAARLNLVLENGQSLRAGIVYFTYQGLYEDHVGRIDFIF